MSLQEQKYSKFNFYTLTKSAISSYMSLKKLKSKRFFFSVCTVVIIIFSSVQSFTRVQHFATPWTAACQASQSITISRSSLKLTSIESVMPSTHLILCRPLFLLPPIPPGIRVFSGAIILPTLYGGFQVGLKWWISPKCVLWRYLGNYWVIPRFIIFYYSDNTLMNDVI